MQVPTTHSIVATNSIMVVVIYHAVIQVEVVTWRPHSGSSICWGFFVANDNLLMDIENPQMLQCIIYRTKQICANDLYQ
jgi:hypothetical protein